MSKSIDNLPPPNYSFLIDQTENSGVKAKIIQNKKTIILFISLLCCSLVAGSLVHHFVGCHKSEYNQTMDTNKLDKLTSDTNKLDKLTSDTSKLDKLASDTNKLDKLTSDLFESINGLQKQIKDMDINKSNITYTSEQTDITDFLLGDPGKLRRTGFFYVRSIAWYFGLRTARENGIKKIGFYLYAFNPSDHIFWSITASCQFKILNQNAKNDLTLNLDRFRFTKLSKDTDNVYVPVAKLLRDGFIMNDTIKIQVYVNADELLRND